MTNEQQRIADSLLNSAKSTSNQHKAFLQRMLAKEAHSIVFGEEITVPD